MMTFWSSIAIYFRSFRSLENFHFPSVKLRPEVYPIWVCGHISVYPMAEIGFMKYQYKQTEVLVVTKPLFWAISQLQKIPGFLLAEPIQHLDMLCICFVDQTVALQDCTGERSSQQAESGFHELNPSQYGQYSPFLAGGLSVCSSYICLSVYPNLALIRSWKGKETGKGTQYK